MATNYAGKHWACAAWSTKGFAGGKLYLKSKLVRRSKVALVWQQSSRVARLEMVWRRRNTEEIVLCDKISKEFDLSEYRIQGDSFRRLAEMFGPITMDWFASVEQIL